MRDIGMLLLSIDLGIAIGGLAAAVWTLCTIVRSNLRQLLAQADCNTTT
jgi:hypothetical protein